MDDRLALLLYGGVAVFSIQWLSKTLFGPKDSVPAIIGANGPISGWLGAYRYFTRPNDVVQAGYTQYRDGVFRVPRLFRWDYIVTGSQRIAEVGAAPGNVLSFYEGAADGIQGKYTIGAEVLENPYHQLTVRTSLTRNLGRRFPAVRDEIACAFDEVLALPAEGEWKLVPVLPTLMKVVARTSNRLFVDLPLCRNQEFLDLNIDNTIEIVMRGQMLALFPEFLKPLVAPLVVTRNKRLRQMLGFVGATIEERIRKLDELGPDYPGKPNDLISWLLEIATGEGRTTPAVASRILAVNMAAIHTSSMALTHVLFDLTTFSEHLEPMREEAERVIAAEGWTKSALNSMYKIDSFIRESQRLRGNGPVTMLRKVVHPDGFKFSDGVVIPCGAFLTVSARPVHYDPTLFDKADVFDGFRFSNMRDAAGAAPSADATESVEVEHTANASGGTGVFNRHMVSTGMDHLVFGHGKHACPGRFFAATELKAMLAHILIEYDIKAAVPGVRPQDYEVGMITMPNQTAGIYMRRRQH